MTGFTDNPDLSALANGTVKGRHIFVLFAVVYVFAFGVSYLYARGFDPFMRDAVRRSSWSISAFAFFAFATICVPELRRLFLQLVRSRPAAPTSDVLLVIALMLTWGLGVSRFIFTYPFVLFDGRAYGWLDLARRADPSPEYLFLTMVTTVVLAPLTEEVVFRGYLLNLWRARYSLLFAIVGSSVVFGLWHFKTAAFATGMGIIFALVYLKYQSLFLCIVLHSLYNLLMIRPLLGSFFMEKPRQTVTLLTAWIPELTLAALFIPLAWLFWKRFRPEQTAIS